ncbi:antitoxin [Limnochorda pilosa]|uniref:Arabinogalactan endo-beta-1,4-galactanase n=2 Tax=Limnochorda pilosa TaxID=1555112 RepID=A0A0K2SIY2_LIMPI|nr:antitoxin [Limnochorda pilosa]
MPFIKGADVSFLDQIERLGGAYFDEGVRRDGLEILRDRGINLIRLRIWNDPPNGFNNLPRTVVIARRIKEADMSFLLDFHYSDFWADPGKQNRPAVWQNLDFEELRQAVYEYSRDVVQTLAQAGAAPDIVQVGNEITQGLLWDDGRVGGAFDTDLQWERLAQLVQAGIAGVYDGVGTSERPLIMIHIDRGGDNPGARWFFDRLLGQGVAFDLIGLSFYPWWHGTLDALRENLADLAQRYQKGIVVVETAYPWTLEEADREPNIVRRSDQLLAGYPASPEGQADFVRDLLEIVRSVPEGRGKGVVYWEPGYISVPPFGASPWENLTLFDFDGNSLPALEVLGR